MQAEALYTAVVNIDAANDVLLANKGAASHPGMFHDEPLLLVVFRRGSLAAFSTFSAGPVKIARCH